MRIDFTDEDLAAIQNRHNIGMAPAIDLAAEERRAEASRQAGAKLAAANELSAYATQALHSLVGVGENVDPASVLAEKAWQIADAMQAERRKRIPDAVMHAIRFGGPCL